MVGIFPLRITSMNPSNLGSADCRWIGEGGDGIDYVLKRVGDGNRIPASEFICSCLAKSCGIAVPPFEIAELSDNEHAFASRWEDGSLPHERTNLILHGKETVIDLGKRLSAIYAFDLFVHNEDRHFKNYMFRHQRGPDSSLAILAPDYSRAFLFHACPPPPLPLLPNCNTLTHYRIWTRNYGFSLEDASRVLNKLDKISLESFAKIIDLLPPQWLSEEERNQLINWWKSSSAKRIQIIREGLPS